MVEVHLNLHPHSAYWKGFLQFKTFEVEIFLFHFSGCGVLDFTCGYARIRLDIETVKSTGPCIVMISLSKFICKNYLGCT